MPAPDARTKGGLTDDGLLASSKDTIATYSGGWIRPLNPDPADINIIDIAHALANQCRWTGHVRRFYSVAEHCILAASLVPKKEKLPTLLHDASEAYLADLARPIKHAKALGQVYRKYETQLEEAIAVRFKLPPPPMSDTTKWADDAMLRVEIHELMPDSIRALWDPPEVEISTQCWTPPLAEQTFLEMFREYGGRDKLLESGKFNG